MYIYIIIYICTQSDHKCVCVAVFHNVASWISRQATNSSPCLGLRRLFEADSEMLRLISCKSLERMRWRGCASNSWRGWYANSKKNWAAQLMWVFGVLIKFGIPSILVIEWIMKIRKGRGCVGWSKEVGYLLSSDALRNWCRELS